MKLSKFIKNLDNLIKLKNKTIAINNFFTDEELLNVNINKNFILFINESGFKIEEIFKNNFNSIKFDEYIRSNSIFSTWQEMLNYFIEKHIEVTLFLEDENK